MVERANSESERTFNQSAANDRSEPTLTDAATATSVRFSSNCELVYAVMLDSNWLVIEVALAHG